MSIPIVFLSAGAHPLAKEAARAYQMEEEAVCPRAEVQVYPFGWERA